MSIGRLVLDHDVEGCAVRESQHRLAGLERFDLWIELVFDPIDRLEPLSQPMLRPPDRL
jgi:hypothetical protein